LGGPQSRSGRFGEDPSVVQPVASRYTDCAIPAPEQAYEHIIINLIPTVNLL
jgi:hypothetical protein